MKRGVIAAMSLMIVLEMAACGNKRADDAEIIGGADEPTTIELPSEAGMESDADEHFLEYLRGNEADANGEMFRAVGEADMEYALYDMNGDGVNELIVREYGSWIYDIILYKDDRIQSANVENFGSSGVTLINDRNQFVSGDTGHEGRKIYAVSEIDGQGDANVVMAFVNYYDDWAASGFPEFYKKENPPQDYLENISKFDPITEADFNSLVEEYSKENTSIVWISLKADIKTYEEESGSQKRINDDQALVAIKNYCLTINPGLEDMINSDDYTIYWDIDSSDENQIVVLYRSYTAALFRYYIDTSTGETYVTAFVQGIMDDEERTDESFNVRDYFH